ncbi:uncharacterized protein LOC114365378 isoform X2 [Ostrinia furnacalis]|uniref:uncharacterized protein LOC114365378 isoform X2 n=1 Tax=Ostrinia furnacalis TaxID=93504 RepID=UPI00103A6E45|nr:uncharacterized protein LOC114365378 isoform X2 [Ostrinia furnacalis]
MCTNSARLVNSLECYMDDLVDCFEDFVKKSLLIISVAVGALIVMLGYVLKIISERAQVPLLGSPAVAQQIDTTRTSCPQSCSSARTSQPDVQNDLQKSKSSTLPQKSTNSIAMPCFRKDCRKTMSAAANTGPLSSTPSFDEKVLRNIGLSSCSKGEQCTLLKSVPRKNTGNSENKE